MATYGAKKYLKALAAGLCLALLPAAQSSADFDPPYPRIAAYNGTNSSGYPLVQNIPGVPLVSRPLDESFVEAYARFSLSIFHATPLTDLRPDISAAIRAKNPRTKIFAYVMPNTMWCGESYDPSTYFYKHWRILKQGAPPSCDRDTNRFLFFQDGTSPYDSLSMTHNMAFREKQSDGSYRYTLAEELAELVYDSIYLARDPAGNKIWDGIFHDVYCKGISWIENSLGKQFDHVRAGYSTHAEFLAAWDEGQNVYARKLRELIGDNNYPLVGNCGQGDSYSEFNGWMVENFPLQNGGTWYENMYRLVGGYFNWERLFRKPTANFFSSLAYGVANSGTEPIAATVNTTANCRNFRLGLGSASLGSGFADIVDENIAQPFWSKWYFPEQGVDTNTGKSSKLIAHHGWLGSPKGAHDQIIWADETTLGPNPSFETDLSGWNKASFTPAIASFSREVGGAPEGGASIRAEVEAIGAGAWMVSLGQQGNFSVSSGRPYSITFWAKADKEGRIVDVVLARTSDNGNLGVLSLPLTPEWKRYQVVFYPNQSTTAAVRFDLGRETGKVWLDGIRVQQGISSVYRRVFQKGMALVNPFPAALNVPLGGLFRKIWDDSTSCPGYSYASDAARTVSDILIPSNDAVFLLNLDHTPPAKPQGLAVKLE